MLLSSPRASVSDILPSSVQVGNSQVAVSTTVKSLGVTLDPSLSMERHVVNICRAAYFELRRISTIRRYLTTDATKTLVCSFVLSRLDYCNSLLSGSSLSLTDRLQKVQNNAARLILKGRKFDHVTPLLQSLHWLPVVARIQYKVNSLSYVSLFDSGPVYLSDLQKIYTPSRRLRSSADSRILCIPRTKTKTFGERSFAYQSPFLWNSLPSAIRHSSSTISFRKALKTHLFREYYLSDGS